MTPFGVERGEPRSDPGGDPGGADHEEQEHSLEQAESAYRPRSSVGNGDSRSGGKIGAEEPEPPGNSSCFQSNTGGTLAAEARLLPLGHGLFALVSPEDFERASAHRWHLKRKRSQPGKFYVQRTIRLGSGRRAPKTTELLHRFIMGAAPGVLVDHRNGNGLDNQRRNLRCCDNTQNQRNITASKRQKRGQFKGVAWNARADRWQAQICAGEKRPNGKRKQLYLGLFDSPADAARAYDSAAREHFGEFAALNFPANAANRETGVMRFEKARAWFRKGAGA